MQCNGPAGNTATATFTVTVKPIFSGLLQPVNADGSSIFKLGSIISLRFQLQDTSGNSIANIPATLRLAKITDGVLGNEMEAQSTGAADTDNQFRVSGDTFQYNWGARGLTEGTWGIIIYLNYGQPIQLLLDNDVPSDGKTSQVSLKG